MVYFWIPREMFEISWLYKGWDYLEIVSSTKSEQKHMQQ